MKLSRVAVIAVSALALVAGVWLGLLPIKASMTMISPDLRLLTVSCGNGYLGAGLSVHPGDLVEIPGEHAVYLPKASYDAYCRDAVGWRRYGAWGLTGLGVLGLAMTLATARTPGSSALAGAARAGASARGASGPDPDPGADSAAGSTKSEPESPAEPESSDAAESSGELRSSTGSARGKGGAHRARSGDS